MKTRDSRNQHTTHAYPEVLALHRFGLRIGQRNHERSQVILQFVVLETQLPHACHDDALAFHTEFHLAFGGSLARSRARTSGM
jgi:hypothetical protein